MRDIKQPSLRLNFLMNILLTVSGFLFPLITFPYISRVLLPEGNGKVQMATAFIAYFTMISQLGIPTYGIRACAAVREDRVALSRTVHELIIIQAVSTVISYVLFFLCLAWVPRLAVERELYLITSLSVLLGSLGIEWLFKALEQYTYITLRSLLFKLISVVAMFLLVHTQADYVRYAGITVLAVAGSNIMNLTQIPKLISLKPLGGYQFRRHIRPVLVLFAYTCATTIYTNLDSVMLGFMTTDAEVGFYSVAVKMKIILVSIVTALGAVLLPRVSYYYEQKQYDQFWKMAVQAFRVVLLMALPMTVYFMLFAKNSIFFLSGDAYGPSVLPMIIIMPTLVFIGLTSITGIQILIPTKRENSILLASVAGGVIDLILNALLIPTMGAAGAAIGTLVAEFVVLVYHCVVLRKELRPLLKSMKLLPAILAVAAASVAVLWVPSLALGDFWALAISATVFFGVYAIVLFLAKEPFTLEVTNRLKALRNKHKN